MTHSEVTSSRFIHTLLSLQRYCDLHEPLPPWLQCAVPQTVCGDDHDDSGDGDGDDDHDDEAGKMSWRDHVDQALQMFDGLREWRRLFDR